MERTYFISARQRIALAVGALSTLSGVLALFGMQGTLWVGGLLTVGGVLVALASFSFGLVIENQKLRRMTMTNETLEVVQTIHQGVDLLKCPVPIEEVHILGSGTETYFGIMSHLLESAVLSRGITVHLGYRVDSGGTRQAKLAEYKTKWAELARRFDLHLKFYPFPDYMFFLRGIVLQRQRGCIGFYYRHNNATIGVAEKCVLVTPTGPLGDYLLSAFTRCFTLTPPEDAMRISTAVAAKVPER